jgi:hypothetical protein
MGENNYLILRSRTTWRNSSRGSASRASAMAKNSGTFTCRWLVSIMPTTECGRLRSCAKSRCDSFLCSRAFASTVATAFDVALRRAFKFYALRLTERAINKA